MSHSIDLLFALVVAVFLPVRAWRRHLRGSPPASTPRYVVEASLLIVVLSVLLWQGNIPAAALGLKPFSSRWLADVAVCLLAIIGTDWWMARKRVRQIHNSRANAAPQGLAADALAGYNAGISYIVVIIVGAIWEELCFRGTVLALLPHTTFGILLGVIGGSLLFGAQHLRNGVSGMIYSTGFGVVFALLFLATGNLWAVMLAHAGGNLLTALKWAPQIERARQSINSSPSAPLFLG